MWRLAQAGWDVRYEPAATVQARRARASAAHGCAAGPSTAPPPVRWPGATPVTRPPAYLGLDGGRVGPGAGAHDRSRPPGPWASPSLVLARRLDGLVDEPVKVAGRIAGGGTARSALPALGGLTRAWSPALLLGLCWRKTRPAAALALLVPAAGDWLRGRRPLDPVRYAALHVADDVAYGSGVWLGCLRARTLAPLLPRIELRTRLWSTRSLRTQLGAAQRGRERRPAGHAGTLSAVAAVVLQGAANSAPERIVGPFATVDEATAGARDHPRPGGYSVAQELNPPGASGDD